MSQPKNQTLEFRKSPIDGLGPGLHGLIIDMDGVLWRDQTPIGDLPAAFAAISERGLLLTAATNNATRSADDYAQRLQNLGVTIDPAQIITSAEATALTLARRLPSGGRVFVVGEQGTASCLKDAGFQPVMDPTDEGEVVAVVAGMDRAFTYEKLRVASRHVREGALFYGTNPDATFPTPDGLVPGSGTIIAAIATAAEIQPTIIGKPSPLMFQMAADRMGIQKDRSPGRRRPTGNGYCGRTSVGIPHGARTLWREQRSPGGGVAAEARCCRRRFVGASGRIVGVTSEVDF